MALTGKMSNLIWSSNSILLRKVIFGLLHRTSKVNPSKTQNMFLNLNVDLYNKRALYTACLTQNIQMMISIALGERTETNTRDGRNNIKGKENRANKWWKLI